ncbi:MAG: hypothetical protein KDB26_11450, partial [Microthrixaceae bacterium]|nr:hypothetical protein [Microthrixaceae bacterium]
NVVFVWRRDGRLTLSTSRLTGTILEGITRDTLLGLARSDSVQDVRGSPLHFDAVVEEPTSIDDIVRGSLDGSLVEMFACGTAAVIAPIGTLVHGGEPVTVGDGQPGPVTIALRESLLALQYGRAADPHGWLQPTTAILNSHGIELPV